MSKDESAKIEAAADFKALFYHDYDDWISKISDPNYQFDNVDTVILERFGINQD